ncbi:hypothetical protein [Spirillospora sp. CA-294931]|uniref:hypothetical protein n=1 Tax=Spirillospora sp. CA-294931 TaxID=3240042 RepID=UPI003D8A8ECF
MLAELLPALVGGLRAEKNMRWNAPGLAYARPIRRRASGLVTRSGRGRRQVRWSRHRGRRR